MALMSIKMRFCRALVIVLKIVIILYFMNAKFSFFAYQNF
jgi:hypothetical protein